MPPICHISHCNGNAPNHRDGQELPALLREIEQDRAGLQSRDRLPPGLVAIDDRGNLVVRADCEERRIDLLVLADVDRDTPCTQARALPARWRSCGRSACSRCEVRWSFLSYPAKSFDVQYPGTAEAYNRPLPKLSAAGGPIAIACRYGRDSGSATGTSVVMGPGSRFAWPGRRSTCVTVDGTVSALECAPSSAERLRPPSEHDPESGNRFSEKIMLKPKDQSGMTI